jgi:sigma-B regulation protein RsbU (phosphoserine phosphatase)
MLNRIAIGFVLTTLGAVSLAVALMYRRGGATRLVSFGLFSLAYGLRFVLTAPPLIPLFGPSPRALAFAAASVSYMLPALMLIYFDQIQGPGWRSLMRRAWWAALPIGAAFIAYDVAAGRPGLSTPYFRMLVLTVTALVLPHALIRRSRDRVEDTTRATGTVVLLLAAVHDTLLGLGWFPWQLPLEVYGVAVFIITLGFVSTRRVVRDQRELAAVERELDTARSIQAAILPRDHPRLPDLDISVRYVPSRSVAGDVYDFVRVDDRCVGMLVADVTGHGVAAALIASMVEVAYSTHAAHAIDPGSTLSEINRILYGRFEARFVTAVCLVLDTARGSLRYSLAGHPPPLLCRRGQTQAEPLSEGGIVLGLFADARFPSTEVPFGAGDRLLLYTDGLTEAKNDAGEWFGDAELDRFLLSHRQLNASAFADALLEHVERWADNEGRSFADDLTLAVIDHIGAARETQEPHESER